MVNRLLMSTLCAAMVLSGSAQDSPTMGWSSWNTFALNINDDIIKSQADAMVSQGLSDVGFKYINIDDGFFGGRRISDGQLLIHPVRFPNGLRGLVDYIHSLGLKAGIYSDAGRNTCGHYWGNDTIAHDVGLYGYDQKDADFYFKELDFDFIKVDFCGGTDWTNRDKTVLDEKERYTAISNAIKNTGKKGARLNVCRWDYPGTWVGDVALSWRTTCDIADNWESVAGIIKQNLYMSAYSSPGHYNDMDMLEVGRSLTAHEDETHYGLWCIMNSPLLIGCDMRNLKPHTLALLKNQELIALNQEKPFQQAYVADKKEGCYILVKDVEKLGGKMRAFAVYNPTDAAQIVEVDFASIDLGGVVAVRDLFKHEDLGRYTGSIKLEVPPHGTRICKVKAQKRLMRRVYEGECGYISDYQELENNQTAMTGIYEENDACHGGAKASWLGGKPENDLVWRNVAVPVTGDYRVTLHYQGEQPSSVAIDVNGNQQIVLTTIATGDDKVATVSTTLRLRKGNNIVRLHNNMQRMADIDCMVIE